MPIKDRFTPEEIAKEWTKLFEEDFSVDALHHLVDLGKLEMQNETYTEYDDDVTLEERIGNDTIKLFYTGRARLIANKFITQEERERFESEHLSEAQPETVQTIPTAAAADIEQITPMGGDRLTAKLYDFANEVGVKSVTTRGFRAWLSKKHKDFDTSHGSIAFRQENGEWADVTSGPLKSRIYRLKATK